MARILPPSPNLDHLKNEAKALVKACRKGHAASLATVRLLDRFKGASDMSIQAARVRLSEAQYALAMDYGFKSWQDLKRHVQAFASRGDLDGQDEARPGALLIADPPSGKGDSNRFARGFAITLARCGAEYDYETIMGDSGLAFILQTDEHVTPWGKPIRKVDIGWWPLTWWGALMRLDFVSRVAGRRLARIEIDDSMRRKDAARHYRERFEQPIVRALRNGRLPLVFCDFCYVVTGHDDGEPPILGVRSVFDGQERVRPGCYPEEVVIPGRKVKSADRVKADKAALAHAVALGHDRAGALVRTIPRCSGQGVKPEGGRWTGQKSFALWARLLRDDDLWGEHFYHANVVFHLRINRRSAPGYLRKMARRHRKEIAGHLTAAADVYEEVLACLGKANTHKETLRTAGGRETLGRLVEETARLESEAVKEMEHALAAMK